MSNRKIMLSIFFFIFFACNATTQENPTEMFIRLYEKYKNTEYENVTLNQSGEGTVMRIFNINNEISKDIFCRINFYSSLGQTQYLIYKNDNENSWYFHKEVLFYDAPFILENAEIQNTYFKYMDKIPYAFNEITEKYDIQADTKSFQAIRDVASLSELIEIVQREINKKQPVVSTN
ncbi:MAG: hypothetical protein FWH35_06870 [Treponema sp.]|nr:hypothetical protein [Treponema sp.]